MNMLRATIYQVSSDRRSLQKVHPVNPNAIRVHVSLKAWRRARPSFVRDPRFGFDEMSCKTRGTVRSPQSSSKMLTGRVVHGE